MTAVRPRMGWWGAVGDPLYSQTTLIMNFNNNLVDASPVHATFTNTGSVPFSSGVTPFAGTSSFGLFNADPQGTSTTSSTALQLPGNFTIEGLIYPTATGAANGTFIISAGTLSAGDSGGCYVAINPGTLSLVFGHNGSAPVLVSSAGMTLNAWNQYQVTRTGSTVQIFIATTSGGTTTDSTSFTCSKVAIGRGGTSTNWQGYIGPHRVTTAARANVIYTAPFPTH